MINQEGYKFTKEVKRFFKSIRTVNQDHRDLAKAPAVTSSNGAAKRFYTKTKEDHSWLAFCDEKDDFLRGKVPDILPDFSQEEEEE